MDSLKQSMAQLSEMFNSGMNDFQCDLKAATPAASPSSNINSQFHVFRTFVLSALESLQLQVEMLTRQQDELEIRSHRKILLIHGVVEEKKEITTSKTISVLSEHLKLENISQSAISRCHRLGPSTGSRIRAILVRFHESRFRDKCWSLKSSLKGTGITFSEFLTKPRHDAFVLARKQFGVTNCWTRDGSIIVLGSDGVHHRVTTVSEVNTIHGACSAVNPVPPSASMTAAPKENKVLSGMRSKRLAKK